MKRREFMAVATAAPLVSPRSLRAQGTPRRIGFLGRSRTESLAAVKIPRLNAASSRRDSVPNIRISC